MNISKRSSPRVEASRGSLLTSWTHRIQKSKGLVEIQSSSEYYLLTAEVIHEHKTSKTETVKEDFGTLGFVIRVRRLSDIVFAERTKREVSVGGKLAVSSGLIYFAQTVDALMKTESGTEGEEKLDVLEDPYLC